MMNPRRGAGGACVVTNVRMPRARGTSAVALWKIQLMTVYARGAGTAYYACAGSRVPLWNGFTKKYAHIFALVVASACRVGLILPH